MKRLLSFLGISFFAILIVAEVTNALQHQQHIRVAGDEERTLLAGHSLIRRLTLTGGIRFCHGGEPLYVTTLAIKRLLDSGLQASSIILSVAPQSFNKASHLRRMEVKEFAIEKDMELARSLSWFQLLDPNLHLPRRWQAMRWKLIPMYQPEMAPADSFFMPPESLVAWRERIQNRWEQKFASEEYEEDWGWDDCALENLQLLLHHAQENNIPIIGLITPQQRWSWEQIPTDFEQMWQSTLQDLDRQHELFHVVDLGKSPALHDRCFTDPVHLSPEGSTALRDTLEKIVAQIEGMHTR